MNVRRVGGGRKVGKLKQVSLHYILDVKLDSLIVKLMLREKKKTSHEQPQIPKLYCIPVTLTAVNVFVPVLRTHPC